jgi:hypothetical protein
VNTSTNESQRDISQNRNQSAREKFLKRGEIKRLLSKEVILQEKTLLEAKNLRTDTQNRNTNTRNCPERSGLCSKQIKSFKRKCPTRTETQETILRTEIILLRICSKKN